MVRRKTLFMSGGAVFLLVIVLLTYMIINSASDGTITPVTMPSAEASTTEQRIIVTNQYARFSYPTKFTRVESAKPITPVLQSYNFVKQQIGSWQIAVQLTSLDGGSLNDDSSYNYRSQTPARYQKTQPTIGNNKPVVFSDVTSDVFAKTAYLQHGNIDASISMIGGTAGSSSQLQTDFDALVDSWQWR